MAAECRNQTQGTGRGALLPQPPPQPSSAHSLEGTAPPPPPPQDTPAGLVGAGGAPGGGTGGRVFDTARGIYFTAATQRRGPGQPRKHNMRGDAGRKGGSFSIRGFVVFFFFPLLLAPFARLKTTQQHTRPTRLYPKKKKLKFAQERPPRPARPLPGRAPHCPVPHGTRGGAPTPCHTGSGRVMGTPSWGAASRPCRPPGSPAPLPDVAAIVALARFTLLFLAFLARLLRLLLLLVLPAHAAPEVARKPRCFICGGDGQRFRGGPGAAAPSPGGGSPQLSPQSGLPWPRVPISSAPCWSTHQHSPPPGSHCARR